MFPASSADAAEYRTLDAHFSGDDDILIGC
jgi:hypothetical protein